MTDELDEVVQWAYDLNALDAVLARTCQTDAERDAVKRILGVDKQEQRAADAFTPQRAPTPVTRTPVDHTAHTRAAITRYQAWVDAHPDDDPTPLLERQRVLRIAQTNLQRLKGDTP